MVDTGSTDTAIPKSIVEELGLRVIGKRSVKTAKGDAEVERSYCLLRIEDEEGVVPVVVSDTLDMVLIGVTTLESLGFKVDPATEKLVKRKLFLRSSL